MTRYEQIERAAFAGAVIVIALGLVSALAWQSIDAQRHPPQVIEACPSTTRKP